MGLWRVAKLTIPPTVPPAISPTVPPTILPTVPSTPTIPQAVSAIPIILPPPFVPPPLVKPGEDPPRFNLSWQSVPHTSTFLWCCSVFVGDCFGVVWGLF